MARFLPWELVEQRFRPTPEMLADVAGGLQRHRPFQNGATIVYGSVAWGAQTWRSDLDVALNIVPSFFANSSLGLYEEVSEVYDAEFDRVFGKTKGDNRYLKRELLLEELGSQRGGNPYELPQISPSTRDHFRLLAQVKKGPYRKFNLHIRQIRGRSRGTDISNYLDIIQRVYQSLREDRGQPPTAWSTVPRQMILSLSDTSRCHSLENFPKQLSRKLLGLKGLLPCPDTWPNILQTLVDLREEWSEQLLRLYTPFLAIHDCYTTLIDEIYAGNLSIEQKEYDRLIINTVLNLPVMKLASLAEALLLTGFQVTRSENWEQPSYQTRYPHLLEAPKGA